MIAHKDVDEAFNLLREKSDFTLVDRQQIYVMLATAVQDNKRYRTRLCVVFWLSIILTVLLLIVANSK